MGQRVTSHSLTPARHYTWSKTNVPDASQLIPQPPLNNGSLNSYKRGRIFLLFFLCRCWGYVVLCSQPLCVSCGEFAIYQLFPFYYSDCNLLFLLTRTCSKETAHPAGWHRPRGPYRQKSGAAAPAQFSHFPGEVWGQVLQVPARCSRLHAPRYVQRLIKPSHSMLSSGVGVKLLI